MIQIDILTDIINRIKEDNNNNLKKQELLDKEIRSIEECLITIKDENKIINYDFNYILSLFDKYKYSINNLSKVLKDIKDTIQIKKQFNDIDIPFTKNQIDTIDTFANTLNDLIKELKLEQQNIDINHDSEESIVLLEQFRNIIMGNSKKKYYTDEMVNALYEVGDIMNLSDEEYMILIESIYNSRNFIKKVRTKADIMDVISLYKEYISTDKIDLFINLIKTHEEEIVSNIDLDNTREILEYFKSNNILNNFMRLPLLKVTLYGNIDYIKELYPKMLEKDKDNMDIYFENEMASIWINESSKKIRKRKSKYSRKTDKKEKKKLDINSISYEEFWENIELINDNSHLFADKYDSSNFGAHLRAKTVPSENIKSFSALLRLATTSAWTFRKNLGLCKIFGMGYLNKIPISCFESGDIEDKIHLAIELGLLNPPMTMEFINMEQNIVKNDVFIKNMQKQGLSNESIRNYFQRNITKLATIPKKDYIVLSYYLLKLGHEKFYNAFFSPNKAGQCYPEFLQRLDSLVDEDNIDEFISKNFITEWYSEFIPGFTEYDNYIDEYSLEEKGSDFTKESYFDDNILNDEFIKELEKKYCVNDIYIEDGKTVDVKNDYVYLIGGTMISRYKVLRNASILKGIYGKLNEDMLLTSIVRNSYFDEVTFDKIKDSIKERNKKI